MLTWIRDKLAALVRHLGGTIFRFYFATDDGGIVRLFLIHILLWNYLDTDRNGQPDIRVRIPVKLFPLRIGLEVEMLDGPKVGLTYELFAALDGDVWPAVAASPKMQFATVRIRSAQGEAQPSRMSLEVTSTSLTSTDGVTLGLDALNAPGQLNTSVRVFGAPSRLADAIKTHMTLFGYGESRRRIAIATEVAARMQVHVDLDISGPRLRPLILSPGIKINARTDKRSAVTNVEYDAADAVTFTGKTSIFDDNAKPVHSIAFQVDYMPRKLAVTYQPSHSLDLVGSAPIPHVEGTWIAKRAASHVGNFESRFSCHIEDYPAHSDISLQSAGAAPVSQYNLRWNSDTHVRRLNVSYVVAAEGDPHWNPVPAMEDCWLTHLDIESRLLPTAVFLDFASDGTHSSGWASYDASEKTEYLLLSANALPLNPLTLTTDLKVSTTAFAKLESLGEAFRLSYSLQSPRSVEIGTTHESDALWELLQLSLSPPSRALQYATDETLFLTRDGTGHSEAWIRHLQSVSWRERGQGRFSSQASGFTAGCRFASPSSWQRRLAIDSVLGDWRLKTSAQRFSSGLHIDTDGHDQGRFDGEFYEFDLMVENGLAAARGSMRTVHATSLRTPEWLQLQLDRAPADGTSIRYLASQPFDIRASAAAQEGSGVAGFIRANSDVSIPSALNLNAPGTSLEAPREPISLWFQADKNATGAMVYPRGGQSNPRNQLALLEDWNRPRGDRLVAFGLVIEGASGFALTSLPGAEKRIEWRLAPNGLHGLLAEMLRRTEMPDGTYRYRPLHFVEIGADLPIEGIIYLYPSIGGFRYFAASAIRSATRGKAGSFRFTLPDGPELCPHVVVVGQRTMGAYATGDVFVIPRELEGKIVADEAAGSYRNHQGVSGASLWDPDRNMRQTIIRLKAFDPLALRNIEIVRHDFSCCYLAWLSRQRINRIDYVKRSPGSPGSQLIRVVMFSEPPVCVASDQGISQKSGLGLYVDDGLALTVDVTVERLLSPASKRVKLPPSIPPAAPLNPDVWYFNTAFQTSSFSGNMLVAPTILNQLRGDRSSWRGHFYVQVGNVLYMGNNIIQNRANPVNFPPYP